ncbi:MAG: hypothetical protein HC895_23435 [Leptolyngbyaceae cyanobacterium SM1_3_5]|nr:hypothetical protein [Leptolyngbyaceae cyanobacterium SM1_3_5]
MSSFPDPITPSEQDAALAALFSLLVDLQCIEPPTAAAIEPPEPEPPAIEAAVLPSLTVLPEQIVPLVAQVLPLEAIALPIEEMAIQEVAIEKVAIDEAAALEQLQRLLTAPDLAEFRPLVESLERKLTQMEHQLYEPAELINC